MKHCNNLPGVYIYNLGTGKGYSVLEMVREFERANNLKIEFKFAPRREGDIVTCYADASKAFKELGWRAEKTLSDMVRDSYEWQRKLEEV